VRDTDDIDELYERQVESDVDDIGEVLHWSDDTDDIDELYECQVESDVDNISEVLHWSDEWVVALEQMVDQTHFIVTAETFQQHNHTPAM